MTGETLKAWRKYRKMTRHELSLRIGREIPIVFRQELGELGILPFEAEDYADALDLTLEQMDSLPPAQKLEDDPPTIDKQHLSNDIVQSVVQPFSIVSNDEGSRILTELQPAKFLEPPCRIGFELADSIEVGDGSRWKRIGVYLEFPCAKADVDATVIEIKQQAKRILREETEHLYAELAAEFNKSVA